MSTVHGKRQVNKPITPQDLIGGIKLPDEVFKAVNKVLKEQWVYGKKSMIIKRDIFVEAIMEEMALDRKEVFDKAYLDFEEEYRSVGWQISYNSRPERTDPYYEFTIPID